MNVLHTAASVCVEGSRVDVLGVKLKKQNKNVV